LEYNSSNGGYLKLIGLFKKLTDIGKTVDRRDIILGITIDEKKLTLCNCTESKTSFSNGIFSSTYWIQIIIENIHLQTSEETKFKSITARISYVDEWIGNSGIEQIAKDNNYEIIIKNPKQYKCKIGSDLVLELIPSSSMKFGRITGQNKPLDISVSQYYDLRLSFANDESLETYLKVFNRLLNFLTLSIGQQVHYISIWATHISYSMQHENETIFPKIALFPALSRTIEISQIPKFSVFNIIIQFKAIENNLDIYFNKWLELEETFEPTFKLFFDTVNNPDMYSYHTFSSLIQSAEVYHRRKHPEMAQFDKTEFESIRKSIENFVPQKFKEWISKTLEYSNEIILRKRLENLIKTNPLIKKLFRNKEEIDSFIFKITETRHYITHYSSDVTHYSSDANTRAIW
jgi:ApeA N-terminal domain 1